MPIVILNSVQRPISPPDALLDEAFRRQFALHQPGSASFSLHTVRGELVNPNLDLDRTSRLIELDDQAHFEA